MNEIPTSHMINPDTLRQNDFNSFFKSRQNSLLKHIEIAMSKPIARDAAQSIEGGEDEKNSE
ncbi:hypothetical protein MFMK1_000056 [Metallumcola ferriviriculae]|uniref:Uncharacterized protein n=1 Tax=Metallumcola ferriviriculae TaxID=3039180 RepID=A0AAU0UKB2_9FIRM|nr:hypothetical protein MFMK1_000056 [Desulfitibacteraceae bacterium MK1]